MSQFRNLRIGAFLPPFHDTDQDPLVQMERDFSLIQQLDRLGYAEAWVGEHHSGGFELYGQPELFVATAAERSRYIRLGTGVISLPYHNPFMVAQRIVQLDYQTRGRAMFGFGPGLLASDAHILGIDPKTQRDRMAESIDIITRLIAGETITQSSEWYDLRDARLHIQPYTLPRPEMVVTSSVTPSGGKTAGRFDLGMLCVAAGSVHGYDTLDLNWNLACEAAAKDGRTMDRERLRLMACFHIADTREEAIADVAEGFEKWQNYSRSLNPNGGAAIGLPSIEEINAGGLGAIGSPEDAVRVLENYWQKTGGFGVMLLLAHNWASWEKTQKSFDLFASKVIPAFNRRNDWRNRSMEWNRANMEHLNSGKQAALTAAIEKHFNEVEAGQKSATANG